jgi:NAD(P)-dependent dehydrogenase (short-subunit alcohol dehydrogenase family)
MASYLITGSSRGLGLALAARLAALPKTEVGTIIATARQDNSASLTEIVSASSGRVQMLKLDVTDIASVEAAVGAAGRSLQGKGLDVLINNAGMMDWSPTGLEGMYVDFISKGFHDSHLTGTISTTCSTSTSQRLT